jgi:hypothetical protein
MTHDSTESSLLFSLAELQRIEQNRTHTEEAERARERERQERERREVEVERQRMEQARRDGERAAQVEREQREAKEKALARARERAAVEVARIEAEAKARLAVEESVRAHELAVLRAKAEGTQWRPSGVLTTALAALLCVTVVIGAAIVRDRGRLQDEALRSRLEHSTATLDRERAVRLLLQSVDQWIASLSWRSTSLPVSGERDKASAARKALDDKAPEAASIDALINALEDWDERIVALQRLVALEQRYEDLTVWAARQGEGAALPQLRAAARKHAEAGGAGAAALESYASALDDLREALQRHGSGRLPPTREMPQPPCKDGDPLCDQNRRPR